MRIVICDDDAACLADVRAAAETYAGTCTGSYWRIDTFSHPEDLLEAAEKCGGYEIYVLDVIMPGMNGIELGLKLREAGYDGRILYLTSSPEYSLDAFRVKAFDYIIKPINAENVCKALAEATASIAEKKDKTLLVKSKERSIKLNYGSIMYAEIQKRAACYYLVDGRKVESMTLRTNFAQAMAELLEDKRFAACGQSMVVNLDHVTEVETGAVVFGTTYRVFLGEKLCRKLRDIWAEYLFGQEG